MKFARGRASASDCILATMEHRLFSGGFPWRSERCKEAAESERALVTGGAGEARNEGLCGGGAAAIEVLCWLRQGYTVRFVFSGDSYTWGTLRRPPCSSVIT